MKNKRETISVIDFGGQYAHLIANRFRRLGTYAEILFPDSPIEAFRNAKGIVFTDSPIDLKQADDLQFNSEILNLPQPKLAICFGKQLLVQKLGGRIKSGEERRYLLEKLSIKEKKDPLFKEIPNSSTVWMRLGESSAQLPDGFQTIASTPHCPTAVIADDRRKIYAIQFHPEVTHTQYGNQLMSNFLEICGCKRDWSMERYYNELANSIRSQTEGKKVFLLVSGGVDSTVCFVMLNKILGKERVLGLHIDSGMMRLGESAGVMEYLVAEGMDNLKIADASSQFLTALRRVVDPEKKRNIIGDTFLRVKDDEIERLGFNPDEWLLAQGTIYPDTVESGVSKNADLVKTHHNRVAEIVELMEKGLVVEPLSELYKDEVRALGEYLGIPKNLIWRHPFPGPGLGVRLLCSDGKRAGVELEQIKGLQEWLVQKGKELSLQRPLKATLLPIRTTGVRGDARHYAQPLSIKEKLSWEQCRQLSDEITRNFPEISRVVLQLSGDDEGYCYPIEQYCNRHTLDRLRLYDSVVTRFLHRHNLYDSVWQMPVVLLPLKHHHGNVVVLRPINSSEAMTATFAEIDQELLEELIKEMSALGVATLLYDITDKPPATIEWE